MTLKADIIITGGKVRTMDSEAPVADAVAIAGNRIVAVGDEAGVVAMAKGDDTRMIDAKGATVMPGFNDSHLHIFGGSVGLNHLSLLGVEGFDALKDKLTAFAEANPDAPILIGFSAEYSLLGEDGPMTRHHLDKIIADRPVMLTAPDYHTAWANTAALKAAGILEGKELSVGHEIVMGEDGLASGELREGEAMGPVRNLDEAGRRAGPGMRNNLGEITVEERAMDRATLLRGLNYLAENGITSLHNMDGNLYQLELMEEIEAEQGLPVRVRIPMQMLRTTPLSDVTEKAAAWRERFTGDRLKSDFVKIFIDGVVESGTAVMLGGYGDAPDENGDPLFSQDELNAAVTEADRLGFQVATHAIGDGGVRMILDAYKAASDANGTRDSRHRIEHIETIDATDIPRLGAEGVLASMQPLHAPGSGDLVLEPYVTRIGKDRWETAFPAKSLQETGAYMVVSTDWPVVQVNPLVTVQASQCRHPWAEGLKDQRLSLDDTLEAYTLGGAYAEFMEDRKGKLKAGYLADVVVLSGDIAAVAPDQIATLSPVLTICDGKITFEAA